MTSAPTVSVITISLNDLDGLKRTVDSVRAQRYEGRIEHIVIDGGSGDAVVEYLSGCEPGFSYWQSQPDGGRYDGMNQGIAHATGDLLWFMHSGDRFSDPDAVAQVAEAISGHGPARDLWGYGMYRVIKRGRIYGGPMPFHLRWFVAGWPRWQGVPHQASFFGSSLVDKVGLYNLEFGFAADQEFIFRAALHRTPITIRRVLCDFDGGGISSNMPARVVCRELRRLWDFHGYYPLGGRRISIVYLTCWEYCLRFLEYAYERSKALGRLLRSRRSAPTAASPTRSST
ncbi:glycosyltransferase family 2 protein [Mycobacterium sp. 663a-19]|uniref:glycosyltransferase family 2 protein n=1 Tax=Mycobacterium sp. 663a-19 TaxID=2986148 RepID=UPI002D1ECB03|nr:glycosyltransferase family 2 protein [Mycobacterium sp. 663a-19]MEB3981998.1 glycosyltransferase family 2 protein [Mycobacterium sp. 663a-19]